MAFHSCMVGTHRNLPLRVIHSFISITTWLWFGMNVNEWFMINRYGDYIPEFKGLCSRYNGLIHNTGTSIWLHSKGRDTFACEWRFISLLPLPPLSSYPSPTISPLTSLPKTFWSAATVATNATPATAATPTPESIAVDLPPAKRQGFFASLFARR
jgi:hypothetical protein